MAPCGRSGQYKTPQIKASPDAGIGGRPWILSDFKKS